MWAVFSTSHFVVSAVVSTKHRELTTRAVATVMVSVYAQLNALRTEISAMRTHGLDSILEVTFLAVSLRARLSLTVSLRVDRTQM